MKKLFVLVVLFVFTAGSVCFAADDAKTAKDPVTATAVAAGKTVQAAGEVAVAPVKAVTGTKATKKAEKKAEKAAK